MAEFKRVTDRGFKYVPSSSTDIRKTFAKHGWIGPEEKRKVETEQWKADYDRRLAEIQSEERRRRDEFAEQTNAMMQAGLGAIFG